MRMRETSGSAGSFAPLHGNAKRAWRGQRPVPYRDQLVSDITTQPRGRSAMLEAEKSFRRLKAHRQLPDLRAALLRPQQILLGDQSIARKNRAA